MVSRIAPLLRGLLAHADGTEPTPLPMVRFSADRDSDGIELGNGELLDRLRDALGDERHISVRGLGTFSESESRRVGRLASKVAVVTGAAQGFGLGIAEGLAAEGATVVLADLNQDGARKAAESIPGAVAVQVDVTDGASVASAFDEVCRIHGGIDLLVSNAGVLRAGSVKEQSESDFDFVTRVNYKGYFNCVQHAARIMAEQHRACPTSVADIVQINSKSGLQGSNRNGAYAGSKFGTIGLTQSFAMELIEDGVKVNSICPGNFFEGPLWSDPENGLFVQYLRAGKVPGAQTVQDVKRFYEGKVPMGRGCRVPDVMKALLYLVDQQYETGQALPVTGGQVMLN